jgi:hypothetical protein
VLLRQWFGGKIRLEPLADGGLKAHWNQNSSALLKGVGTSGSGGHASVLELSEEDGHSHPLKNQLGAETGLTCTIDNHIAGKSKARNAAYGRWMGQSVSG